jgi:hypothetical protein
MPSLSMSKYNSVTFTSNGPWTAPEGVTRIIVRGCGAGQNGFPATTNAGGRGGAGAAVSTRILSVNPFQTYTITIAAAGSENESRFDPVTWFAGGNFSYTDGVSGGNAHTVGLNSDYAIGGSAFNYGTPSTAACLGGGGGASIGNGGAGADIGLNGTNGGIGAGGGGGGFDPFGLTAGSGGLGGRGQIEIYWVSAR